MDFAIMVGGALSTRSESPEPFEDGGIEGGVIISFDQLSLNSDHDASPNRAISTRSESPEPIEAIRGGVIISVERPEPERPSSPLKSSSFLVSQNEEEETKVKEKASVSKGRQPQAKKATPPPKKKKVPVTTGKEPQAKEAKKEKAKPSVSRKTVVNDFNQYFGAVSKLKNWQALCKDLSIEPVPTSLTQCRKVRISFPFSFQMNANDLYSWMRSQLPPQIPPP